jgi:hypothetical protein
MVERGANIDVVFRNGLKDYEVLPPADVWDKIHPEVRKKQRPFIILRAAAMIIVLLSVSLFAYLWNRDISSELDNQVVALNVEAAYPIYSLPGDNTPAAVSRLVNPGKGSSIAIIQNFTNDVVSADFVKSTYPDPVLIQETSILPKRGVESLHGPYVASLYPEQKTTVEIMPVDPQYMPESGSLKGTQRWSVSALASPTYYSKLNPGGDAFTKQLMASEQNLASYSGGVAFSYKINKKFSIQSGIYYSSVGQVLGGINSYGGFEKYDFSKGDHNFEVRTTNGTIYTNNQDVYLTYNGTVDKISSAIAKGEFDPKKASLQYINNDLMQSFSYLELPVMMRYKLIDKTIDLNLIGGVSYNMLVTNSVYTMVGSIKYPVGKTEGLNPISLSSTVGMGMEYNFSEKLSLNLEPTVRYYLNPYNQTSGLKVHPYSFGIFSGLSYKF